eukprot:COSAG04_NODE_5840_length_1477_cov_19.474601_2_plen_161_part_01
MVFTPRCYWPRRTDDSYQDIVAAGANGLGPSALPQPTTTLSCSVLTAKFFVACGSVDGSGRAAQLRVVVGPAHLQDLRPRRARFGLGSSVRGRVRSRAPPVPARLSSRHSRRHQSAVRHQTLSCSVLTAKFFPPTSLGLDRARPTGAFKSSVTRMHGKAAR